MSDDKRTNNTSTDPMSLAASISAATQRTDAKTKTDEPVNADQGPRRYPPVHLWNPPYCGEIDMRIAADGTWYYMGTPIGRQAMVKLFASVLRRDEDDHYYLITPVEKVRIRVDDAPLLANRVEVEQVEGRQQLRFFTQVDDQVVASKKHPIRVAVQNDEPRPYIFMRDRLEALIHRNVFYQLVDLAQEVTRPDGSQALEIVSGDTTFELGHY